MEHDGSISRRVKHLSVEIPSVRDEFQRMVGPITSRTREREREREREGNDDRNDIFLRWAGIDSNLEFTRRGNGNKGASHAARHLLTSGWGRR